MMSKKHIHIHRRNKIFYFFPFQLVLLHLKKNTFLLLLWVFLFAIITGGLAQKIGVPQQFLLPEYLGVTGVISFGILGFAVGGFISAFNLYTYIRHGYRFPFIATLNRPFQKFCINNSIIPAIFIIVYFISSARYQSTRELIEPLKIVLNLTSFFVMLSLFQFLSFIYFVYTNKNANSFGNSERKMWTDSKEEEDDDREEAELRSRAFLKWLKNSKRTSQWYVETYISSFTKISLARDCSHYSKEVLDRVFDQNHVNASRFEFLLILTFLLFGTLRGYQAMIIPAPASTMLFFTVMIMLFSAIHAKLRGWTMTLAIVFFVGFNYFYEDLRFITQSTKAYGMNYNSTPAQYDLKQLIPDEATVFQDKRHAQIMLENWKNRNADQYSVQGHKPKLLILNHSGGGSRSAFWNMLTMAYADSITDGKLFRNAILMTGASGGMLGAAYIRELQLKKYLGEEIDPYDYRFAESMAKDLLNPIIMSAATNDWLIRYQKIHDGEYSYSKDRATAFEEQMHRNTGQIFSRRLMEYAPYEYDAVIPMMILSPAIVNDGRRMLIASQPISYLTTVNHLNGNDNELPEDVEFRRMFAGNDADNLQFLSALRMSATFPYVLPMTSLPSTPVVEMVDAGVRDNFGLKTTMQFLYTFKDWINNNTSGVVVVQIRDLPKNKILREPHRTFMAKFSAPIGGIYGNLTKTQDYNNEQALRYLQGWFYDKVDVISFELNQNKDTQISLSWHLTKSEKNRIIKALEDSYFQHELERLKRLLE